MFRVHARNGQSVVNSPRDPHNFHVPQIVPSRNDVIRGVDELGDDNDSCNIPPFRCLWDASEVWRPFAVHFV